MKVNIVGAGLTGSEAAWQLASRGVEVKIYEMRDDNRKTTFIVFFFCFRWKFKCIDLRKK